MRNLHPVNCGKRQYTWRFWTVTTIVIIVLGSCDRKEIAFISILPPLISRLCRWFMFDRWLLSLFAAHRYLNQISRNFVYVITLGQFWIDCSLFCITFKLRTERFVGSELRTSSMKWYWKKTKIQWNFKSCIFLYLKYVYRDG